MGERIHLFVDFHGRFDSHHNRGVRGRIMHLAFIVFTDTVRAKARQTSTMTSIILASSYGDCETMPASTAYSIPHTARRTLYIVDSSLIDVGCSFRCTSLVRMTVPLLNLWETTVNTSANNMLNRSEDSPYPCRSPCSTSNHIRKDTVTRSHTGSHPIMELSDGCYHLRWYSNVREYLPQEGTFNGVVRLLEINRAHEERQAYFPRDFLQPAHHKHYVRGRTIQSKPALVLR